MYSPRSLFSVTLYKCSEEGQILFHHTQKAKIYMTSKRNICCCRLQSVKWLPFWCKRCSQYCRFNICYIYIEKLRKFSTNFSCNLLEIRVKFKIFQFQWFLYFMQLKTDLKIVQNIIQTCLNDLFYFLNLIILNQKYDEQKYSAFCRRIHLDFEWLQA